MLNEQLIFKMTEFYKGDPKRIQHFIKVYEYAHMIGKLEGVDKKPEKYSTLHPFCMILAFAQAKKNMVVVMASIRNRKVRHMPEKC